MLGNYSFIRTLSLRNFLSYGDDKCKIELKSLNVLIGPNASGKSNLIEALGILRAAPTDLTLPIREGGGISEWLWKGKNKNPVAEIDATINFPLSDMPLRYKLAFSMVGQRFELEDEVIENEEPRRGETDAYFFYRYYNGRPFFNVRDKSSEPPGTSAGRVSRKLQREDLDINQSVLSQRKDPDQYPELTYLVNQFSKIKIYREWNLGRYTEARIPQQADLEEDFLREDYKNLGLIINDLQHQGLIRSVILEKLKKFCGDIIDITTKIHGGNIQIFLHERGLLPIPATRLSDGSIRFICLLAILCHPAPPSVVCIEEPELGLHPDVLPIIAELLIEASNRTQIFVTTHSDILVSALTDVPESIIISERTDDGSKLYRLKKQELNEWVEKYTLGELWRMGEIGGNP